MPRWLGQFLPGEGILKGMDLLISITLDPGLNLTLVLSLWKPGISFQGPQVSMGTPQYHISSPVAITTPGITSPWALLLSPTPQSRPLSLPC